MERIISSLGRLYPSFFPRRRPKKSTDGLDLYISRAARKQKKAGLGPLGEVHQLRELSIAEELLTDPMPELPLPEHELPVEDEGSVNGSVDTESNKPHLFTGGWGDGIDYYYHYQEKPPEEKSGWVATILGREVVNHSDKALAVLLLGGQAVSGCVAHVFGQGETLHMISSTIGDVSFSRSGLSVIKLGHKVQDYFTGEVDPAVPWSQWIEEKAFLASTGIWVFLLVAGLAGLELSKVGIFLQLAQYCFSTTGATLMLVRNLRKDKWDGATLIAAVNWVYTLVGLSLRVSTFTGWASFLVKSGGGQWIRDSLGAMSAGIWLYTSVRPKVSTWQEERKLRNEGAEFKTIAAHSQLEDEKLKKPKKKPEALPPPSDSSTTR